MMKNVFTTICVSGLMLLSPVAFGVPVQWETGVGGNGHYYEVVQPVGGLTWPDAKADAESRSHLGMPGYLATITSAEESAFVISNLINNLPSNPFMTMWLGGFQDEQANEPAGDWQWVTGESWVYSNWQSVAPNNALHGQIDEDYLEIIGPGHGSQPAGSWNDLPYTHTIDYIVEYVPEPAAIGLLSMGGLALARRRRA